MSRTTKHTEGANVEPHAVGVYIAYDGDGNEIWRKDDFEIGKDKIPAGLSIGMKAMRIRAKGSKKVLKKWDPWGVL